MHFFCDKTRKIFFPTMLMHDAVGSAIVAHTCNTNACMNDAKTFKYYCYIKCSHHLAKMLLLRRRTSLRAMKLKSSITLTFVSVNSFVASWKHCQENVCNQTLCVVYNRVCNSLHMRGPKSIQ